MRRSRTARHPKRRQERAIEINVLLTSMSGNFINLVPWRTKRQRSMVAFAPQTVHLTLAGRAPVKEFRSPISIGRPLWLDRQTALAGTHPAVVAATPSTSICRRRDPAPLDQPCDRSHDSIALNVYVQPSALNSSVKCRFRPVINASVHTIRGSPSKRSKPRNPSVSVTASELRRIETLPTCWRAQANQFLSGTC